MTTERKQLVGASVSGLVFGVGLVLAGMTSPAKVIGFLDVFGGSWDPSLALVMGGAIAVHAPIYRLIKGRTSPLFAGNWSLPTRRDIDGRLVFGAVLFGAGWGLGGFCPGPGLVALVSGSLASLAFVVAMLGGLFLAAEVEKRLVAR